MNEIMRLTDPDGSYPSRVGIGTATPDYLLDIHSSTTAGLRVKNDSGNTYVNLDSSADVYLQFRKSGTATWAFITDYAGTDTMALYNYNNSSTNVSVATNGTWNFYNNSIVDVGHADSQWTPTGLVIGGTGTIKIAGGSPADGKVLTATDSAGNSQWETVEAGTTLGKAIAMALVF